MLPSYRLCKSHVLAPVGSGLPCGGPKSRLMRQLSQPFPCGRVDCIGERGRGHCRTRLADSTGRLAVPYQTYVDRRRLIHSQDAVVVEVGLLDPTIVQRDFAPQCAADAAHDPALDLRLDDVWIHDLAAVHRAHDPTHPYVARAGDLDFSNLRQVGAPRAEEQRDPTSAAAWHWFAPSSFLRRELQYVPGARRLPEQCAAECHRVLFRHGGELVDEALDDEVVMGDAEDRKS